tara:strand:+ start:1492 stop:4959 length:3468 start_codon:yes stop_codon:yes gene_type:complete
MATVFNKRLFGTDLDPEIKNKLRARQMLAKASVLPNESKEFIEIQGKEYKVSDLIGDVNFGFDNELLSLGELSSRTPFARMWTCVELYWSQPDIYGEEYGVVSWQLDKLNIHGNSVWTKKVNDKKLQDAENKSFEKKVYIVNNHHLNHHEEDTRDPMRSVHADPQNFTAAVLPNVPINVAGDTFPNELKDNKYMKPPAGITNISSKTEGILGAIKRTTINFKVHNFQDFEDIYSVYFLKPGALIFVDMGWDTHHFYDPDDIINKHLQEGITIKESLFGVHQNDSQKTRGTSLKRKKGIVEKSNGDFEVLVGRVVSWDAKGLDNGGWDCSIEIVSENDAILDHMVSEENMLKKRFTHGLGHIVLNESFRLVGLNYLRNDWTSSKENFDESWAYATKMARSYLSSMRANHSIITQTAMEMGVYFQITALISEFDDDDEGTSAYGRWENYFRDTNIADLENLYVGWGFFEDEILNKELSLGFQEEFEIAGRFDSSESFVVWSDELMHRQELNGFLVEDKRALKFLMPKTWEVTYNSHKHKTPSRQGEKNLWDKDTAATYTGVAKDFFEEGYVTAARDIAQERIPFREVFVNLKVIQDAFLESNSVNEAIKLILDELSSYSFSVWDLKLTTLERDNSTLAVVDRNYVAPSFREKDFYDDLFVFKPHDPESIVKGFDINFTTPKNGLQNMIAINNTGYDNPLFPLSADEEINNAIRNIMKEGNQLGTRSFPVINSKDYLKNKDIFGDGNLDPTGETKSLVGGQVDEDKLKGNYKAINQHIKKSWDDLSTGNTVNLEEAYQGLDDFEYDFDELWGPPFMSREYKKSQGQWSDKEKKDGEYVMNEDEDVDLSIAGSLVAKNLEEWYGYKAKAQFMFKISSIMPIDLSLTLYGISGIHPGDFFRVDWLPNRYRENVYFQVTNVEQEINSSTWSTKLSTVMRIRLDKKDKDLYLKPRQILLSRNWFEDMGMPPNISKYLTNIEPQLGGNGNFIAFTARGQRPAGDPRQGTSTGDKEYVWMTTKSDEDIEQWNPKSLTHYFKEKMIEDLSEYTDGYFLKAHNWHGMKGAIGSGKVEIKEGNKYIGLIFFRGVLLFDKTFALRSGFYKSSYKPNASRAYIFTPEWFVNKATQIWEGLDEEWKDAYLNKGQRQYLGGGYKPADWNDD